jgi:L-cystine transport system permease protein
MTMRISFDFPFFLTEIAVAFSYIPIVAALSVLPLAFGSILGGALAFSRIYRIRAIQSFAKAYVVIMRSIPLLLQMFLVFYLFKGLYDFFGWEASGLNKFTMVVLAFTMNAAGFLSEGIRSALLSVEAGQFEAGYSVGMTRMQAAVHFVLPQSLPVAIPMLGSAFIGIVQGSAAAYLLGVVEMIQATSMKTAGNYRFLEAYCAVALIYWGMTILIERFTFYIERRVRKHAHGGVS